MSVSGKFILFQYPLYPAPESKTVIGKLFRPRAALENTEFWGPHRNFYRNYIKQRNSAAGAENFSYLSNLIANLYKFETLK